MKISIVMPLYNAEKFLNETLDSILQQTFTDYELLCINDASNDQTVNIVNEYKKKDARICLINNEERMGAAKSRNRGIETSKGEYIIFLDGDDIFDETMLEQAYNKAISYRADIVMFEYAHVISEDIHKKKNIFHSHEYIEKFCKSSFDIFDVYPCEMSDWATSPCNKLFSNSFLKTTNLKFQTLKNSNDVFFVEMAYVLAKRIIKLDDMRVMIYARDHSTPTRISFDRDPMCVYEALSAIKQEIKNKSIWDKTKQYYWYLAFSRLIFAIDQTKNQEKAKEFFLYLQNQGMEEILDIPKVSKQCMNDILKRIVDKFLHSTFESQIRYQDFFLAFYLEFNKEKVLSLINDYKKYGGEIGMWGLGKNGIQFMQFCKDNQVVMDYVIDQDCNKQKLSHYYTTEIITPDKLNQKIKLIIVSSMGIYNEVKRYVTEKEYEINIIDLCTYLNIV
mgnify:CR=1 FL=1